MSPKAYMYMICILNVCIWYTLYGTGSDLEEDTSTGQQWMCLENVVRAEMESFRVALIWTYYLENI